MTLPRRAATPNNTRIRILPNAGSLFAVATTTDVVKAINSLHGLEQAVTNAAHLEEGFATFPNGIEGLEAIFKGRQAIADKLRAEITFRLPEKGYVLKRVPTSLLDPDTEERFNATDDLVKRVVEDITGQKTTRFRIGMSMISRPYEPAARSPTCKYCFGPHSHLRCKSDPLCYKCGQHVHSGPCHEDSIIRCQICLSEKHETTDKDCPLWPTNDHGCLRVPTKEYVEYIRLTNKKMRRERIRREEADKMSSTMATLVESISATQQTMPATPTVLSTPPTGTTETRHIETSNT
ncbi:uncharacterized protein BROUX77_005883 [Berkeleyomyces rouxiae]|uniref:uncharacterized protein n=1 Tax=Berkeleyomyces rouxiae TaxID=2035830 RepID=UPI003B75D52F